MGNMRKILFLLFVFLMHLEMYSQIFEIKNEDLIIQIYLSPRSDTIYIKSVIINLSKNDIYVPAIIRLDADRIACSCPNCLILEQSGVTLIEINYSIPPDLLFISSLDTLVLCRSIKVSELFLNRMYAKDFLLFNFDYLSTGKIKDREMINNYFIKLPWVISDVSNVMKTNRTEFYSISNYDAYAINSTSIRCQMKVNFKSVLKF